MPIKQARTKAGIPGNLLLTFVAVLTAGVLAWMVTIKPADGSSTPQGCVNPDKVSLDAVQIASRQKPNAALGESTALVMVSAAWSAVDSDFFEKTGQSLQDVIWRSVASYQAELDDLPLGSGMFRLEPDTFEEHHVPGFDDPVNPLDSALAYVQATTAATLAGVSLTELEKRDLPSPCRQSQ